jgi:hypothetical protein
MTITAAASGAPYHSGRKPYYHKHNRSCAGGDLVFPDATTRDDQRTFSKNLDDYLEEMIPQHFDRRVQFFFEQAICCYKTDLTFFMGEALTQAQSPKALKVEDNKIQRNAAHSSTLPTLFTKEGESRYVFLEGTHAYSLWNATMNMPRYVNEADMLLDGKGSEDKLRLKTLALLNRTATGELTPDAALPLFLKHCADEIAIALEKAKGRQKETLQKYQTLCKEAPKNDQLVNLFLGKHKKKTRETLYTKIQKFHLEEFRILQEIDGLRKKILGRRKRQPHDFESFFFQSLLTSTEESAILRRFLHLPPNLTPSKVYKKTVELLEKWKPEIKTVADSIIPKIKALEEV